MIKIFNNCSYISLNFFSSFTLFSFISLSEFCIIFALFWLFSIIVSKSFKYSLHFSGISLIWMLGLFFNLLKAQCMQINSLVSSTKCVIFCSGWILQKFWIYSSSLYSDSIISDVLDFFLPSFYHDILLIYYYQLFDLFYLGFFALLIFFFSILFHYFAYLKKLYHLD